MAIIGIDLGTSNTLACVFQNGRPTLIPNRDGGFLTPSAVSLDEDGSLLVGKAARERLDSHPKQTAASYKVFMGSRREILLKDHVFQPEELSALVLRQIKDDAQRFLGETIEEAVISVPAYFNDDQRCATKLAAELAGLKVSRLINEPSAAAVFHRWQNPQAGDGKLMIVDFGGGTLDVSIVECFENIIEIQAIAGDNRLGGDDIDQAIAAYFCQQNGLVQGALAQDQLAALLKVSRKAKHNLSEPGIDFTVLCMETPEGKFQMELDQILLAQLCEPLFQRVEQVLRQALEDPNIACNIRQIVLVGGSSRMPVFQEFLQKRTSVKPILVDNPDHIVALGVGLCAGIKERKGELQDIVMTDVCPFSLGVASYNSPSDTHPHISVLIPRGTMLPASRSDRFRTLSDGQKFLKFEIYQGERYFASENLKLGELQIQVPYGPAGSGLAQVMFTYDINGILHVEAISNGGQRRETVILNPRLRLSPTQLETEMHRLEQFKLSVCAAKEQALFQEALHLYTQLSGELRRYLGVMINAYSMAQDSGEPIWILRETKRLESFVQGIKDQAAEDPLLIFREMAEQTKWHEAEFEAFEEDEADE